MDLYENGNVKHYLLRKRRTLAKTVDQYIERDSTPFEIKLDDSPSNRGYIKKLTNCC